MRNRYTKTYNALHVAKVGPVYSGLRYEPVFVVMYVTNIVLYLIKYDSILRLYYMSHKRHAFSYPNLKVQCSLPFYQQILPIPIITHYYHKYLQNDGTI